MENLRLKRGKALVLVAHPDDETIWMGGTILSHKNIDWTVLVLCRGDDPDRAPKFFKTEKFLGVKGIISDLEDEGIMDLEESFPEIKKRIKNALKNRKFDYIFTHAKDGEYGHIRHKGAHQVVKKMIKNGELSAGNLFFFSYKRKEKGGPCTENPKAGFFFGLSSPIFKAKRNIITGIYGFEEHSFECQSCTKIETFNKF